MDLHIFGASHWNFINLLWWYLIYLIIHDPCGLSLVYVHLKTQTPLPVFIDWLEPAKPFTGQLIQRFWEGNLLVSMDGLAARVLGQPVVGVG